MCFHFNRLCVRGILARQSYYSLSLCQKGKPIILRNRILQKTNKKKRKEKDKKDKRLLASDQLKRKDEANTSAKKKNNKKTSY